MEVMTANPATPRVVLTANLPPEFYFRIARQVLGIVRALFFAQVRRSCNEAPGARSHDRIANAGLQQLLRIGGIGRVQVDLETARGRNDEHE